MKRSLVLPLLLLFLAAPLLAVDECGPYRQLVALYQVRNALMQPYGSSYDAQKYIDRTLDDLRGHGRWVRWVRPSGDGPIDKKVHTVNAPEGSSDTFEGSSNHVYSVRVLVPRKRSLLNANAPVYVGNLVVSYRGTSKTLKVDAWLNPDTSRTLDLDGIVDEADASIDVATAPKNVKQSVVELHFRQAVPEDDPDNPDYDTVRSLARVRDDLAPDTVDYEIATLERRLDPDATSLPLLSIIADLRRADQLIRSNKEDDQERGTKLLKETMRKLR